jgi:hypothetical protein
MYPSFRFSRLVKREDTRRKNTKGTWANVSKEREVKEPRPDNEGEGETRKRTPHETIGLESKSKRNKLEGVTLEEEVESRSGD